VKRYRARHLEVGKCVNCGEEAVTKWHCEYHRQQHAEHVRTYEARKRARRG
jgi:hypothetical protein